jgi:segregation and condensation protein A
MTYNVKIDNFEGPLDLLLFLVRKNEIDIQNIPIVVITQQFIEYIDIMKALNLDIAGEFIVMAATLMYLKSRALLPCTDEEEKEEDKTSLEDLKNQLLEYQQYKEAAQRLKEQNILEKDVFTRVKFTETLPDDNSFVLREASFFDLLTALKSIIERTGKTEDILELSIEQISVKDKISQIMQILQESKEGLEFRLLFSVNPNRIEIITTFLALLELIKLQAVKVYQNISFSSIHVYPVGDEGTEAQSDTGTEAQSNTDTE